MVAFNKVFHLGVWDLRSRATKCGEFCFRYNWLKCLWDILVGILKRQFVLKAAETVEVNIMYGKCLQQ